MSAPSDDPDDRCDDRPDARPEPEWRRKARLARIFGDVLPETTSDEREQGRGDGVGSGNDERLRRDVPPHHGS